MKPSSDLTLVPADYSQHWYALDRASMGDIQRAARLALNGSGLPQVIHGHHEGGACRAQSNHSPCFVLRERAS